jgi:uncharacterized Tic20 family protein
MIRALTVTPMTEPPRPPGDVPGPPDPNSPPPYSVPGETAPGYAPPPSGDQYAPPPSAPYQAPTSGSAYQDYQAPTSGGAYPPPAGGYQQPGAYQGVPGQAPIPPGYANNDEKTFALVAHFGGAVGMFVLFGVGGFIGPLIALLAKGNQSPTVRAHALAALNFQLLWSVVGLIGWILVCVFIGWIITVAAAIIGVILGIIAGVKANEGQLYKYPMSLNLIK